MSDAALELLLSSMRWTLFGQWMVLSFIAPRTTVPYLVLGVVVFGGVALLMERVGLGYSSVDSGSSLGKGLPVLGSMGTP